MSLGRAIMIADDFRAKWRAEAASMERRGALVSGPMLIAEILVDVDALLREPADELVFLDEAARISGYSTDHLARLVRDHRLRDARPPGTRGRLLFRRRDLPLKPGRRDTPTADVHDLASRLSRGKEGHHGHF